MAETQLAAPWPLRAIASVLRMCMVYPAQLWGGGRKGQRRLSASASLAMQGARANATDHHPHCWLNLPPEIEDLIPVCPADAEQQGQQREADRPHGALRYGEKLINDPGYKALEKENGGSQEEGWP